MVSAPARYRVIWILAAGFSLVILTVSAMVWIGLRQTRSIQTRAATLVREHLATARLVDDLERQQQHAGALLIKLIRLGNSPARRAALAAELDGFARSLETVIRGGEAALPAASWLPLRQAARDYHDALQQAMRRPRLDDGAVALLEQRFDHLNHLAGQIIKEDSIRSASVEQRIAAESAELAEETGWLLGGCLLAAVLCTGITVKLAIASLRHLEWQAREINRVSWHLIQSQEEAARRFSHEMHDELGQSLTGLKAALVSMRPDEFAGRRRDCVHLLEQAIGNVRELSQLLRPVILDDFGLDAALRWLADRFQERTRIQVDYSSDFLGRLPDLVETHLFRITQEALTNVARHSGATTVRIRLHAAGERIRLSITDNGVGFSPDARQARGLGLVGMRARAQQVGGTLKIESEATGGVRIEVNVPAAQPNHELQENSHPAG
jgi:signal transduction histidine kinase